MKKGGARLRASAAPFVVISGLSGAGKSYALRALEDLGYYCVTTCRSLIPAFATWSLNA